MKSFIQNYISGQIKTYIRKIFNETKFNIANNTKICFMTRFSIFIPTMFEIELHYKMKMIQFYSSYCRIND